MREERTSRCGWEVLSLGRRQHSHSHGDADGARVPPSSPTSIRERASRGVSSWLNLMSENESDRRNDARGLARSLPRLDQSSSGAVPSHQQQPRARSRTQELCDRWNGLALDIDEILEAPLEASIPQSAPITLDRDYQPFIQTEFRPGVVPYKAESLHLFHTIRNRKHVLHCYEYLLMQTLETDDDGLWQKLCERFGYCDQCESEGCNTRSSKHSHPPKNKGKDPFSMNSISPDLWFLAITLKESKDKLIHFIRSEFPKRKDEAFILPGSKSLHSSTFLSSYLTAFNFVEMYLDSICKFGEACYLPKELFRCANVKTLSLRNNFLESLPPDIGRLSKLERLFLTNNKLQNKSIPFTFQFLNNLTELYIDNNLLDALPGILLKVDSLERVHRHGNHNYFKATFMWYHTDVNDRILKCTGTGNESHSVSSSTPLRLQHLAAISVIESRVNFYKSVKIPSRIKDYISYLCQDLELCANCSTAHSKSSSSYKVFTFKNPYLGNTCVPFQHWACSLYCAREVEIPARREQLTQAQAQDREYERYVRESLSRLRPSQRTLSASSLAVSRAGGDQSSVSGDRSEVSSLATVSLADRPSNSNVSCGIL